jgi:hypothetical protein
MPNLAPIMSPALADLPGPTQAPRVRAWRLAGTSPRRGCPRAGLIGLAIAAMAAAHPALALDWGPFTLTGFAKAEAARASNQCVDCQRFPAEDKQRVWADELVPGKPYGTRSTSVTLFQPWLGAKFDLGGGFKASALLSQRWRDGKVDIPGFLYERNVAISHEEYGRLAVGAMPSRSWSLADYPYGTDIGLADFWGSSGAGYGLNTRAVRYTSRPFDIADGDLVMEVTYDQGNTAFRVHKPRFVEVFAQYRRGDLLVEAVFQDTRNGNPQSWGHGPFWGPSPNASDDPKIGGSGQGIAMVMARYPVTTRWEVLGGVRANRWSGAYAVLTQPGPPFDQWNNMFNVDWGGTRNGYSNPGYAAVSVDASAGVRYRSGAWTAHTGVGYLGRARTDNPTDRGQHNWAVINTAGVGYDFGQGLRAYAMASIVTYGRLGLSPMSMPSHTAFTGVDPRVSRSGNSFGVGAVYVF